MKVPADRDSGIGLPTFKSEVMRPGRQTRARPREAQASTHIFGEALRPLGLNNWQFTLLVMLNQRSPLTVIHSLVPVCGL